MQPHSPAKPSRAPDATSVSRFFIRVLGLGSVLIVLDSYWIVSAENRVVWELTDFSFFPTVLFTLFALTFVNLGLRRLTPRQALTDAEIATLYVMISVATALAGHDIIRQVVPMMANGTWFATPENEWNELFGFYVPNWLTVKNRGVLRGYFEGGTTFWTRANVNAWIRPFFAWSAFIIVLLGVMLCINIILRKQWTEHERLNYPIAQLPIEVIGGAPSFFSNRLMWTGFAVAFLIEALAGLHYLYPALPYLKMKYNVSPFFIEKPWNAMGGLYLYVYLFAVGLGYVMPLDLSFSLWFFYLFWKAQFVLLAIIGWPRGNGWAGEQRAGAWIAIGLLALWTSRHHIRRVIRGLWARVGSSETETDPMYRPAVVGLVLGLAFILLFWRLAGMSLWMGAAWFGIYLMLAIAMTRMRAELGPPTHELHGIQPDRLMVIFAGTRPLGAQNLSLTTLLSSLAYGYRSHPMPHQMEGFKIGATLRVRPRRLVLAMLLAGILGTFVAIGFHIVLYYRYRFAQWGVGEFSRLAGWINNPRSPDLPNIYRVTFGFGFTILLATLKWKFIWWPFYPVGYAVGYGWAMGWMWFSIFLGWLAKKTIFTSGGIGAYRRGLPMFLGFIFGQFIAGSLWSLIGVILNRNMYTLFP